jgi:hypothetical protein
MPLTRFEEIMLEHSSRSDDLAARFARASQAARAATSVSSEGEAAIRDVAAGVAAPALIGCVLWMVRQARSRGLKRLRFLSRDGQIFYELTRMLSAPLGVCLDLEYVYASRLTWSLAATQPDRLSAAPWLFNSFMKSNAADVCVRLGLSFEEFRPVLIAAGVSLDPEERADQPGQADALRRFVDTPDVTEEAGQRINLARRLLADYAREHALAGPGTGLVDVGWTGRMIGSLIHVCEAVGMSRPHALLWGHEPRPATGWTDPQRIAAYMYNTATGDGLDLRVPDAPFIMETFCMADHGIVSRYERDRVGHVQPVLLSTTNEDAAKWGLGLYRATVFAFCAALGDPGGTITHPDDDIRPVIHQVMDAFWCHPTTTEASAWAGYPYDSDPAGTAARPLGRPFTLKDGQAAREDRAWLAGSLAMSKPEAQAAYLDSAPQAELTGAPATD